MSATRDYLLPYLRVAPPALAYERVLECRILAEQSFEEPVLDLGCGEGIFAGVLFERPLAIGVDPDHTELKRAVQIGAHKHVVQAWGDKMPFREASFRTVLANSVLEHIPALPPVLGDVHRVLEPGGRFYATVPTHRFQHYSVVNSVLTLLRLKSLAARWQRFFNRFWKHHNVHTPEGWERVFAAAGFEVELQREYDPRRIAVMNDALVPLSLFAMINKRLFNRWSLLPLSLRTALVYPAYLLGRAVLPGAERSDAGGIVFFSLRKPA